VFRLRYYCQGAGNQLIRKLLTDVESKHGIAHEISDLSTNGGYDEEKERQAYETYFKPRAKLLKKRTGEPITQLRSRRARHYFVSLPGTIAIVRDNETEWYTLGDEEIRKFLEAVLEKGHASIEERCK